MNLVHDWSRLCVFWGLCGILATATVGISYADNSGAVITTPSFYEMGVAAYRSGDYKLAIRNFRQVLSLDANNVNAHYYLGLSLDNMSQKTQALQEYQYVVKYDKEDAIVTYSQNRIQNIQDSLSIPDTPSTSSLLPGHTDGNNVALIAAGGAPTSGFASTGLPGQIAVPLKASQNALMVDAVLTQRHVTAVGTFILDTGATYTSISREMAEQMGLDLVNCEKVSITTANGRIQVPKVTIETLNVNGLEAHNVQATVIDVRPGSSFAGLLGLSFIRKFVVTLDPSGGQVIFQKI